MLKKVKISLLTIISFYSSVSFCQNSKISEGDTSIFYAINLVEKYKIKSNPYDFISNGNMFSEMFVISGSDTFSISYDFPFIYFNKDDFSILKKQSTAGALNQLVLRYADQSKLVNIVLPLDLFFDKYFLNIFLDTKKAKTAVCYIAPHSEGFITSNLIITKAKVISE